MRTKEQIITDMCYTWRHDYGLDKLPNDMFAGLITSGMTAEEREFLYSQMAQLYEHHIESIHKELTDLQQGNTVILPQNKEHAVNMMRVAQHYLNSNS
jgi:hypothetical protein